MKKVINRKKEIIIVAVVSVFLSVPILSSARSLYHDSQGECYGNTRVEHQSVTHKFARHSVEQFGEMRGEHHGQSTRYESLSDTQKKEMATLDVEFEKKLVPVHAKLKTLNLELKSTTLNLPLDKGKVRTVAAEIADLHGKLYLLHTEQELAELDIVTAAK